jgi:hypothetical protein
MSSINLVGMRKLQLLGDSAMWLVIVGVLSLGLGILALVGLLVLARELIVERCHGADSTEDEGTTGAGDVGHASGRRCLMKP